MWTFIEWRRMLNEVLDRPVPHQFREQSRNSVRATFKLDEETEYEVTFERYAAIEDHNVWEVLFAPTHLTRARLGIAHNDRYKILGNTSKENVLKILATVIAAMRGFLSQRHDAILRFTAAEPNRQALYERLVGKMRNTVPGYHAQWAENTGWVIPVALEPELKSIDNEVGAINTRLRQDGGKRRNSQTHFSGL